MEFSSFQTSYSRKEKHFFRKLTKTILFSTALIGGTIGFSSQALAQTNKCEAGDWFPHSQTPRPDDSAFKGGSFCAFHQWSWQMFLWLTQEWDGEPRFLSFVSPQSLLGMEQRGLMPRMTKSAVAETFDEYLQAGTDGILIDHNGRAVYYSQYLNPTFTDFITSNDLTDPSTVQGIDPNTEFPVVDGKGAMELKVSWKIVEQGEDVSDMFTMQTQVAKMVNQGGKIIADPSQPLDVTVALVGFHIGGVVNGHPEMIWATFEHKDNAPNVPANIGMEDPVSDKDFTFYTANTVYADCNQNPANSNRLVLDEATQTFTPITQVCRRYEFGNAPNDPGAAGNDSAVSQLNDSVHSQLTGIWNNYHEVGAIWFKNGSDLKPGLSLEKDDLLIGSLKLSNSTIETFTQTQSTMNNCFRCHNTQQEFPPNASLDPLKATNLNISHAFKNIYFWSQELPAATSKENK